MTREELVEKVARALDPLNSQLYDKFIEVGIDREEALILLPIDKAEAAIDTVYNALKETSEEMLDAGENAINEGKYVFKAMLAASPLASEEETTTYDELSFADRVNMEYKEFIDWCDANPSFDLDCRLHNHSGEMGKGGYISDEKTRIAFAAWRAAKNAFATSAIAPEGRR